MTCCLCFWLFNWTPGTWLPSTETLLKTSSSLSRSCLQIVRSPFSHAYPFLLKSWALEFCFLSTWILAVSEFFHQWIIFSLVFSNAKFLLVAHFNLPVCAWHQIFSEHWIMCLYYFYLPSRQTRFKQLLTIILNLEIRSCCSWAIQRLVKF